MEGSEAKMKKTLILISIFMIMLVSCSGKNKTADKAPAKQTVGLPNPIHESSAEEIAEQLSVNFAVPDGQKISAIQLSQEILLRWILSGTMPNVPQESNIKPNLKIYPAFTTTGQTKLHVMLVKTPLL
jgi:PBP1b-binding outer membrane lipoprotein LpoB